MKKFFVSTAVMLAVLVSCADINARAVRSNGNIVTHTLDNPAEFSKIVASSIVDVEYTQSRDGSTSVSIVCSENLLDVITLRSSGGTLTVGTKNGILTNRHELKVYASSPSLDEVRTTSTADVSIEGKLTADDLILKVTSTGDIEADEVVCNVLMASTSSTGDVEIGRGTAARAVYTASSTGDINAKGVKACVVEARSSSIGDIECYASASIEARASSTGDIYYYGNPASVDRRESSIGDIIAK